MTLGKKIRELRTERGLSQKELAKLTGVVTDKSISRWEKGATMPDETALKATAAALGVTVSTLTGKDEPKDNGGKSGTEFVELISINRIIANVQNFYSTTEIEQLAASIEEMGLLHNLVVMKPDKNGLYKIISGERRYLACELLHEKDKTAFTHIPCKIDDAETPEETELKLIFANATTRDLSDYEKTTQTKRIKELLQKMKADGHKFKGRMREIVADMLNVSPAQVGRMESISKHLIPEFMSAFQGGSFGITAAYELSAMPKKEQQAAFEYYKETGEIKKTEPPSPTNDEKLYNEIQEGEKKAFVDFQNAKAAPPQRNDTNKTGVERDRPPEACVSVTLTDKMGITSTLKGNLALAAAVNTKQNEFTGLFKHTDNVSNADYVTLALTVCTETLHIIDNAKDNAAIDYFREQLEQLFWNDEQ